MKIIRSMFFGCIAMLAAAFCFSSPSLAMSSDVAVYSIDAADFDFVAPAQIKFDVVEANLATVHGRSTNFHTVAYTVQNQPNSLFRQNVEAYSRIDPHIKAA